MLVFCYGTLMSGCGNHRLLVESKLIGEAQTAPEFTMISLGAYPGILPNGETVIKGEVYEVDAYTLVLLDRLEGHPRYYLRTPITLSNGMKAETYIYPESGRGMPEIKSGSWRDR